MQQENMPEKNARGEQDGGFQQEMIHLNDNKTEHGTKPHI